jgi:hypothetical protein
MTYSSYSFAWSSISDKRLKILFLGFEISNENCDHDLTMKTSKYCLNS